MVNPRTQWATPGLAVVLTAVLWGALGGWQWWFPGLWFAALVVVGLTGTRNGSRGRPREPSADTARPY
ncbi:hypothetical protein LQU92_01480 [Kocuria sp. LUK]|uniref:hypothetical protein n=1 Tax=Kocuria sp. LUK TaxID=2897828 RepID=UPI001E4297C9|nr:hypothetical protein [Kocuria sp. LUK]MCD1143914.1 hypothetical protein [Kocuria sp. LUK]